MAIEKFEDILSWQKAKSLSITVYRLFSSNKDYAFKDQIQRASVSIMNNIAEGYERKSNKELKYFLFVAKGSSAEIRSMLYLALSLKYITENDFKRLYSDATEISKMLSGFIKTL